MDSMKNKNTAPAYSHLRFIIHWIAGTTGAWILGCLIAFFVIIGIFLLMTGEVISEDFGTSIIIYGLLLPAGIMMGYTQQHVLEVYFDTYIKSWWWVTGLSWAVGVSLGMILFGSVKSLFFTTLFLSIISTVPAFMQSRLLRPHLSQTNIYILGGAVSGLIWGAVLREDLMASFIFAPIISSVISAIILIWLKSSTTGNLSTRKEKPKAK